MTVYTVSSSSNDGYWTTDGTFDNTAANIYVSSNVYRSFMRFTAIDIPQGSMIGSATARTVVNSPASSGSADGYFACFDEDNATAPTTQVDASGRPLTTATVAYTFSHTGDGEVYTWSATAAVQEVVDRVGWVSGNALVLVVVSTGNMTGDGFPFSAYDGPIGEAPQLEILFTPPESPPPVQGDDANQNANLNPSFETGAHGYGTSESAPFTSTAVTSVVGTQVGAMTVLSDGTSSFYTLDKTAITPGEWYTTSVFIYRADRAGTVHCDIDWYDAADVYISSSTKTYTQVAGASWVRVHSTGQAPGSAATGRNMWIRFEGTFIDDVCYVDATMTNPGSLGNYGDGDQPGWEWNGTPGNSTSSRVTSVNGSPLRLYFQNVGSSHLPVTRGVWGTVNDVAAVLGRASGGASGYLEQSASVAVPVFSGLFLKFVAEPFLRAGTVTDRLRWILGAEELDPDAVATAWTSFYVYLEADDGTVRGVLLRHYVGETVFPGTPNGVEELTALDFSVACQAGDRLVIEWGYALARTSATAATSTERMYVGGTDATDLAAGDTTMTRPDWVEITNADPLYNTIITAETDLAADSTLAPHAMIGRFGGVTVTVESSLIAEAIPERPAAVAIAVDSQLTAQGEPKTPGAAGLVAEAQLFAEAAVGPAVDVVAESVLVAGVTQRTVAVVELDVVATLVAGGAVVRDVAGALVAETSLTTFGVREVPAAVSLDVEMNVGITAYLIIHPPVTIILDSEVLARAEIIAFIPVDVWHDRYHVAGKHVLGPEDRGRPSSYHWDRYHVVPLEHEEGT